MAQEQVWFVESIDVEDMNAVYWDAVVAESHDDAMLAVERARGYVQPVHAELGSEWAVELRKLAAEWEKLAVDPVGVKADFLDRFYTEEDTFEDEDPAYARILCTATGKPLPDFSDDLWSVDFNADGSQKDSACDSHVCDDDCRSNGCPLERSMEGGAL